MSQTPLKSPSHSPGASAADTSGRGDTAVVMDIDGALPNGPRQDIENIPSSLDLYKAEFGIEGMTCGTCVGILTRGLQELPQITSVNIDLIGNSGVVEFNGKETLKAIQEKIDDLGYDSDLVNVTARCPPVVSSAERTVQIKVHGFYCQHCPASVVHALDNLRRTETEKASFRVAQEPTLEDPIVTITYKPSIENNVTLRHFIRRINAADEALTASVHQPPSLEERSRRLQRKERNLILLRLLFTALVAIPTFIIGVVFMSLVPASNYVRQWFEEPVWSGMAMRMDWALFIMTTPVMVFGADLFHRRAMKEIWAIWRPKSKVPLLRRFYRFGSMNLLISAGTMVAYFSSVAVLILDATMKNDHSPGRKRSSDTYFDAVTFLTFFILIGKYLEAFSKAKTGDAVAMLSNLRPEEARLIEAGAVHDIPVNQLEIGDVIQIPHGQSPPTDGVVEEEGSFSFDESSLTGESRPAKKVRGDQVFTGSINVSDVIRVKVTDLGDSSILDKIIAVVREGQAKRAPIERFADILTGYFVPVITLIAITTWLIWLALGVSGLLPSAWLDVRRGSWPFWSLEFAIAVFVVACPCGIGLAAPTALFVGGGLAAQHSILVQGGGEAFQEASQLNTIVFDKTGTLTQGQMKVTELAIIEKGWNDSIINAIAKVLEEASSHPIARAISEFCPYSPANLEYKDIQELSGQGMVGNFTIDGVQYQAAIGNERLLSFLNNTSDPEKSGCTPTPDNIFLREPLKRYQSLGHSTAIFAIRHLPSDSSAVDTPVKPIAIFSISDPIRPEAPAVLSSLRASGLDIHMCTGDNSTTAHAVAHQLRIPVSKVRAGVLPQDKAAYIHELQHPEDIRPAPTTIAKRRIIAFVGDGVNDTPALSAADVSIALSSGSDIAMTTASFILLNSDLNTILTLVSLSKRVFRRVKLNFAWAGIYNICLIPVAAGIFFAVGANDEHGGWRLSPVWASCAMAASSISVVCSSLALRLPEVKLGLKLPPVFTPWRKVA